MMAFNPRPPVLEYTSFDSPSPEEEAQPSLLSRLFGRRKKLSTGGLDAGGSRDRAVEDSDLEAIPTAAGAVSEDRFAIARASPSLSEDSYVATSTDERREMVGLMRWLSRVLYVRDPSRSKEYRRYWMADRDCTECYECGDRFSTFRRRHHCRICGHIFCGRCSSQVVPGSCVGLTTTTVRACFHCARMYHRYARVQQGLPEGATDAWVVSEAALVSTAPADLPSGPGMAGDGPGAAGQVGEGADGVRAADGMTDATTSAAAMEDRRRERERRGSYGSLPDSRSDSVGDGDADQPSLSRKGSLPNLSLPLPFDQQPADGEMQLTREAIRQARVLVKDNMQLLRIWAAMVHPESGGLKRHNFRHKLSYFTDCVLGCDLVDWLLLNNKVASRTQGQVMCQAFLDLRLMRPLQSREDMFRDSYIMYHLREMHPDDFTRILASEEELTGESDCEPQWLRDIGSSAHDDESSSQDELFPRESTIQGRSTFYVDIDRDRSNARVEPDLGDSLVETSSNFDLRRARTEDMLDIQLEEDENREEEEEQAINQLTEAHMCHVRALVEQEVRIRYLDACWADTVCELAQEISASVRPDVKHDGDLMDIRPYVKVKKIAGGRREESEVVYGVVCTKNLTHRAAARHLKIPSLLLIESPIDLHERKDGKEFVSLDTQIRQEGDALRHCVARIVELKPSLVVTQRTVAFRAQEMLQEAGVALVTNMKEANMQRLHRCTHASIVESVESLHAQANYRLGTCFKFRVKSYPIVDAPSSHAPVTVGSRSGLSSFHSGYKTLMFFEECGKHFGCTVVLRGGSLSELVRVKEVLHFAVFAFYNARLEGKYARDCGVRLPPDPPLDAEPAPETSFLRMMHGRILTVSSQVEVLPPFLATVRNDGCRLRRHFAHLLDFSSVRSLNHCLKRKLTRMRAELYELRVLCPLVNPRLAARPPPAFLRHGLDSAAALRPSSNPGLGAFRRCGACIHYRADRHPLMLRLAFPLRRPASKSERHEEMRRERRRANLEWSLFDVRNHQKIAILFSCYLFESGAACVHPWTIVMHFYGRHDLTLGHFLEGYCFRDNYRCPNAECTQPMLNHVRRFVHGDGQISVILRKMPRNVPTDGINTWSWCSACRMGSKRTPLSPDSWHLSFAKFLQLHFHMREVISARTGCQHSFHCRQLQYFCHRNIVASFKYEKIKLYEVNLPVLEVTLIPPYSLSDQLMMDVNKLVSTSTQIIATIFEYIHLLTARQQSDNLSVFLQQFLADIEDHRTKLQVMTQPLQVSLASDVFREPQEEEEDDDVDRSPPRRLAVLVQIDEQMTEVRLWIAQTIQYWNSKIGEYLSRERKFLRDNARAKRPSRGTDSCDQLSSASSVASVPVTRNSSPHRPLQTGSPMSSGSPATSVFTSIAPSGLSSSDNCLEGSLGSTTVSGPEVTVTESSPLPTSDLEETLHKEAMGRAAEDNDSESNNSYVICGSSDPGQSGNEKNKAPADTVDGRARNPEGENTMRMSDKLGVRKMFNKFFHSNDRDKFEIQLSPHEHPQLPPCAVTPVLVCDDQPSSIIAYVLSSADYRTKMEEIKEGGSMANGDVNSTATAPHDLEESGEILSQNRALMVKSVKVLSEGAGRRRTRGTHFNFRSPRRTEENRLRVNPVVKYTPGRDSSCDSRRDSMDNDQLDEGQRSDEPDRSLADSSVPLTAPMNEKHVNIQMNTHSAQFYCKVFFAREFETLRQSIFPQGEKVYIRSLSKCATWSGEGGKSGSTFLKTLDDRFVLKQMSQPEIMSFQEFAPSYFEYMTHLVKSQEPSVLAKILGVYYIGWRTPQAGEKMYILVMENLLYQRHVRQLFDLKGSRRNRLFTPKSGVIHTPSSPMNDVGEPGLGLHGLDEGQGAPSAQPAASEPSSSRVHSTPVLLDENFIKQSLEKPIYLRWHSKSSLRRAIEFDTQLLSQNFIMDYSLLVGVDEKRRELVFGIIDYMRTFTWDKRIEYIFKSTVGAGTAQGPSRMPTIVSPEVYRTRFIQAMEHYFQESPDQWHELLEKNVD